jgi:hypothetical protein
MPGSNREVLHTYSMRRSLLKSAASWFTALCLLFAQVAMAAYACPMDKLPGAAAQAQVSLLNADCCADEQSDTAMLCREHCKGSKVVATDTIEVPPAMLETAYIRLPAAQPARITGDTFSFTAEHSRSPPICVLNCCFRI